MTLRYKTSFVLKFTSNVQLDAVSDVLSRIFLESRMVDYNCLRYQIANGMEYYKPLGMSYRNSDMGELNSLTIILSELIVHSCVGTTWAIPVMKHDDHTKELIAVVVKRTTDIVEISATSVDIEPERLQEVYGLLNGVLGEVQTTFHNISPEEAVTKMTTSLLALTKQ